MCTPNPALPPADVATARNISPRMGVASCFGSPLLNDIVGIGVATTIFTRVNNKPVVSPLNAQVCPYTVHCRL
jgi:sodium/potassium/calcium exchanger 6